MARARERIEAISIPAAISNASEIACCLPGVSRERRPPHIANLAGVEPARPMHGRAVIPHDKIARPPAVAVDELRLRGVFG
jgi:hypothetical protein